MAKYSSSRRAARASNSALIFVDRVPARRRSSRASPARGCPTFARATAAVHAVRPAARSCDAEALRNLSASSGDKVCSRVVIVPTLLRPPGRYAKDGPIKLLAERFTFPSIIVLKPNGISEPPTGLPKSSDVSAQYELPLL